MPYKGYQHIQRPSPDAGDGWLPFTCGHCGAKTTAFVAAHYVYQTVLVRWLLCTSCGDGSVLTEKGVIYPTAIFGHAQL
ncbi:MAG TPA: hypothetical protein VGQ13_03105 [Nitrososphaera sp.]|nr:hypothetical protein [Nitrososphaera sp.]